MTSNQIYNPAGILYLQYSSTGGVNINQNGGTLTITGSTYVSAPIVSSYASSYFQAPYHMHYVDGANYYLLLTGQSTPTSTFNGYRPFSINLAAGTVNMAHGLAVQGYLQAPTMAATDSSTNVATTAMVQAAISGSTTQSLSGTGYKKLAGGLIMQWTTFSATGTWTFPIAFPTACVSVVASAVYSAAAVITQCGVASTSAVTVYISGIGGNGVSGINACVIAYGY